MYHTIKEKDMEASLELLLKRKSELTLLLIKYSDYIVLNAKGDPMGEVRSKQYFEYLEQSRQIDKELLRLRDGIRKMDTISVDESGVSKSDLRAIHENEVTTTTYIRSQNLLRSNFEMWIGSGLTQG